MNTDEEERGTTDRTRKARRRKKDLMQIRKREKVKAILWIFLFIFVSIALIFTGCHSKSNTDQTNGQNKPRSIISNDQQTNNPSWDQQPKNTGPKVTITAHLIYPRGESDRDYFIPVDTEKLVIGGQPLTVKNIRGLEQLKNVRHLILYAIEYNHSDVFDTIKIFSSTIEKIVFANCDIGDLTFLESFPKLKAVVFRNSSIDSTPHFNFISNKDLEYFYLFSTRFGSIDTIVDEPRNYTPEERESVTLDINPSESLKLISIGIPHFPLIINEKTCNKLSTVNTFAILDSTFDTMKNDHKLLKKYHNMILYNSLLEIPDKDVPFEFKFNALYDGTGFEVIGPS